MIFFFSFEPLYIDDCKLENRSNSSNRVKRVKEQANRNKHENDQH